MLIRNSNILIRSSVIFKRYASTEQVIRKRNHENIQQQAIKLSDFIQDLCGSTKTNNLKNQYLYAKKEEQRALNYWNSFEFPPNTDELPSKLRQQFAIDIERMTVSRLVQLFTIMAKKNIRHKILLDHIGNKLMKITIDDPKQITLAINAVSKLTYLNDELITKLKNEFLTILRASLNYDYRDLMTVLNGFAKLHLSDQKFWYEVIHWIEPKIDHSKHFFNLIPFSMINVEAKLLKKINERSGNISKNSITPRIWLGYIHTLATLKMLDASLAGSILNKTFINAIKEQQKEENLSRVTIAYDEIRIRNVYTAAKLELANFEESYEIVDETKHKSVELTRLVKYGELEEKALTTFGLILRLVIPQKSFGTGPEWHSSGAILESRCFVDTERKQFVALKEVEQSEGKPNRKIKEIAVLFFMENHLTRIFDEEDVGGQRLLGIYQMNVRHLKAMGIHPVIFTSGQFDSLEENEIAKVELIRNRILNLSEDFHDNEWSTFSPEE